MVALGRREALSADDVSNVGSFLPVARGLQGGSGVPKTRGPELPRASLAPGKLLGDLERDWDRELREAVPVSG